MLLHFNNTTNKTCNINYGIINLRLAYTYHTKIMQNLELTWKTSHNPFPNTNKKFPIAKKQCNIWILFILLVAKVPGSKGIFCTKKIWMQVDLSWNFRKDGIYIKDNYQNHYFKTCIQMLKTQGRQHNLGASYSGLKSIHMANTIPNWIWRNV